MKKGIILAAVMALGLSWAALAGPFVGLQIVPAVNSTAGLTVGWDFGSAALECSKVDFTVLTGNWTIATFWTSNNGAYGYRFGPKLTWDWKANGTLQYKNLDFVLGVFRNWGAIQLYGELDLGATGTLSVAPLLGVNILFSNLFAPLQSGG